MDLNSDKKQIEAWRESRSRKGAWIEIHWKNITRTARCGRSRKGAWIEILARKKSSCLLQVAPVRERGLKSAEYGQCEPGRYVAPVRERGLK